MNQASQLRASRLRHTLRSSEAAAKQLGAFKAVLPIVGRSSESSPPTPKQAATSSAPPAKR